MSVWVEIYHVETPISHEVVTLHVSVWVEMTRLRLLLTMAMSRSTWACELKLFIVYIPELSVRHAPRERVSWNIPKNSCTIGEIGHAPRERVSWNAFIFLSCDCCILVTLHVSVWVEILYICLLLIFDFVTLHVSVWVEIFTAKVVNTRQNSHAPRERVSWNASSLIAQNISIRHAPRERVSWNICDR